MRPRNQPGSTMLSDPRWFYDVNPITDERTMVINLINITSDRLMSKEGIGTVRMTLGETNYTYQTSPNGILEIVYDDPAQDYSVAWRNYFTQKLGMSNPIPAQYQLANVDTLVIKRYDIKIEAI
jgi:hypothetical protein